MNLDLGSWLEDLGGQTGLQLSCQRSKVPQPLGQIGHAGQLDETRLASAWVVTARICLSSCHPSLHDDLPLKMSDFQSRSACVEEQS